jgi:hypothetical protein
MTRMAHGCLWRHDHASENPHGRRRGRAKLSGEDGPTKFKLEPIPTLTTRWPSAEQHAEQHCSRGQAAPSGRPGRHQGGYTAKLGHFVSRFSSSSVSLGGARTCAVFDTTAVLFDRRLCIQRDVHPEEHSGRSQLLRDPSQVFFTTRRGIWARTHPLISLSSHSISMLTIDLLSNQSVSWTTS